MVLDEGVPLEREVQGEHFLEDAQARNVRRFGDDSHCSNSGFYDSRTAIRTFIRMNVVVFFHGLVILLFFLLISRCVLVLLEHVPWVGLYYDRVILKSSMYYPGLCGVFEMRIA